ncbi:MAG: efflux RND transporter permease subunit [Acidobacteria bacterium]|nr:MAG: efflux RND transporter permease subunit [Acidobacteriota bacterium]
MVFLAAVVFGLLSYDRLPVQLMPDLTYPTLTVRTEYEGAAPEEVENDVTRPIEEAVGVVGGLRRLSSVSRAGISDVVLEFAWDTDMGEAAQDVLEKLDIVQLPETAGRPLILRFDPNLDPIMELSLSGEGELYEGEEGLRRLRRIAELEVARALEPIKGVAAARVKGGLEEEIHVLLDEEKLQRTGISIQTVIDRLRQENINVAGGTLREGRTEYMVRTLNEYRDLDEIAATVVSSVEGRDIRVRDLGRVVRSNADREIATRTDGRPSVLIEIYKEGDANIVAVADRVRAMVEGAAGRPRRRAEGKGDDAPRSYAEQLRRAEGIDLAIVGDRSRFIESAIREVRDTAIWGGLLAIAVLFVFLRRPRPTAIIAASIPVSILVTFAPLHLASVSLNVMSLGGLALGVGMLVDSSIVVLESIQRCRDEGDGVIAATVRGTLEVRNAVIASTLTSIAVFLPMVFVEGVAGQAFADLGLAVTFSLLASMIVALALIPMLASRPPLSRDASAGASLRPRFASLRWLRDRVRTARARHWVTLVLPAWWLVRTLVALPLEILGWLILLALAAGLFAVRGAGAVIGALLRLAGAVSERTAGRALEALARVYPRLLRAALAHPVIVIVAVLVVGWGSFELARGLDSELLPEVHQGEFTVEMALPVGTPLEETDRLIRPVERALLAQQDEIRALLVTVGFDRENSQRADEGENTARFNVLLAEGHRGPAAERRVIERIRRRLAGVPDLEARIVRPVLFSQRTPIEVEIEADDLTVLRRQAERVRERLAGLPELSDVEVTQRRGAPEVQILYDRERLARLGLEIGSVARLVRDKVQGFEATRLNRRDRRVPIVVRLDEPDRETVEDIRRLVINPEGERPIPLEAVADVRLGEGPSEVRRVDGQRVALVRANVALGSLGSAVEAIRDALEHDVEWPPGTAWALAGQSEEWERSRASLLLALALSVFFVYVIMGIQFESLSHPLVIMLTIPLAFVGTVLALYLLEIPLSVVVFLGMIMLAGIVVNNAIVLVDYINTLRARGLERRAAIIEAGRVRLRPILMTTATTVLGLLPLALGLGDGAELRSPMAIAVISGLATSTVLTLIVIPTVYAVLEDALEWLAGRRRADRGVPATGADEVVP